MVTSWGKAGLLLGLAFSNVAVAEDVITSDTYFYGDSPAVYPTRTLSSIAVCFDTFMHYLVLSYVDVNSLSSRGYRCWGLGLCI
jgi:hypothetical protein